MKNPLTGLVELGQSVWMDDLHRRVITSGELSRLIEEDGLSGVTSNPSIFHKAITSDRDYEEEIRASAVAGKDAGGIYEAIAVEDIRAAADAFRPLYDESEGAHGFVSLDVSPHLAYDTERTLAEARRLWGRVGRPNIFIKVPGTREGLPAIRQLVAEGVNVNITLLFGLPRYREVAEAHLAGLEARVANGKPVDRVASVASFFLSRIDVLLDSRLEEVRGAGGAAAGTASSLIGQTAIASAKLAYQIFKEIVCAERFAKLARAGARPQRLLWASTSTKDPAYSDVKYVEPLIGPQTINTMPVVTLDAYRDHGRPTLRLEEGVDEARATFARLPEVGIDLDAATQRLEDEGVQKFIDPFDRLIGALEEKRRVALRGAGAKGGR